MYLIIFLFLKHLWIDFLWQPSYEWQNKGKFGHWGGIRHSLKHCLATLAILYLFANIAITAALFISLAEFIIHYFTDLFKVKINETNNWKCDKHEQFWKLLGIDQTIHNLTYCAIMLFI